MKSPAIWIYDKDEQLQTILHPENKTSQNDEKVSEDQEVGLPYFDGTLTEELNGEMILEFSVPADHEKAALIEMDGRAVTRDPDGNLVEFIIRIPEDEDGPDGPMKHIFAEGGEYELIDEWITGYRVPSVDLKTALAAVLQGTRWSVGEVADLGKRSLDLVDMSVKEAISELLDAFNGEIGYRIETQGNQIIKRYIDISNRRGDYLGKRFEIGKDIQSIRRIPESTGIKTLLYGRGAAREDGSRITFADVEWKKENGDPIDKPRGQTFIEDVEARNLWGYDQGRKHRKGMYDGQEEAPAELLMNTWRYLQTVNKPSYTYELKVITLASIIGYEHELVRLGDSVDALNRRIYPNIIVNASIIKFIHDLNSPEHSEVILGDFREKFSQESRMRQLERRLNRKEGTWDSKPSRDEVKQIAEEVPVTDDRFANIVPLPPEQVKAEGLFQNIVVSWDYNTASYIAAYEVFASEEEGFTPAADDLVFRGKVSTFIFEGETNKTYYFKVRAVNYHEVASGYSEEVSASTVHIISDDILFGPDIAEKLRELSETASLLADGSITSDMISELAKELIKDDVKEYTNQEVQAINDQLMQELAEKAGLEYVDGQLLLVNHKVNGLEGTTTQIQNNISSIENAASQLQTRVNDLQSDMVDLEVSVSDDVSSLQSTASSLLQRAEEQESALASANGRIVSVEENIDTINGTMSTTISELTSVNGIVSEHQTTIEQHAGLISEKASITSVDTLTGRISTAEGSIETIAGQVSIKANAEEVYTKSEVNTELGKKVDTTVYNNQMAQLDVRMDGIFADVSSVQSEVSDVDTRLVSAQTQLNIQAGLIDAKAERSELTTVDGKVTGVRKDLTNLQIDHSGLSSSVISLRSDFDGLEIGGRNLAKGTSSEFKSITMNGWNAYHDGSLTPDTDVIPEEFYTVRVYYKNVTDIDMTVRVFWTLENGSRVESTNGSVVAVGEEGYSLITRKAPSNAIAGKAVIRRREGGNTLSTVEYKELKFEKGNKATAWSPAPEDIDSAIYTVEEFASSIDQKADSIATNVSSLTQTVNGQGSRITSAEATLTQHATSINLKANATDVYTKSQVDSAVNGRVSTTVYNNKMGELDVSINGILGRVSNTETTMNSLTGEVSSALSQIASLDIRADGIVQSVSEVRADFDGLEVGGRNLFRNSQTRGIRPNNSTTTPMQNTTMDDESEKYIRTTPTNGTIVSCYDFIEGDIPTPLKVGETYLISLMVRVSHDAEIRIGMTYRDGSTTRGHNSYTDVRKSDGWVQIYLVVNESKVYDRINTLLYTNVPVDYLDHKNWKIEKGNKATDWTPAPEDVDSVITALNGRISSAEGTLSVLPGQIEAKASQTSVNNLTGRVSQAESSLSVQAGQIAAKVEKDGVIASINLSSEGLRINGALNHITGQTLIENAVIGSAAIANAAITKAKLGTAIIGTAQIEDAVITNAKIANLAIDTAKIANAAITNAKIANLAVNTAQIANAAITDAKIASLSADKITAGTLSADRIWGGTITGVGINILEDARIGANLNIGQRAGANNYHNIASIHFGDFATIHALNAMGTIRLLPGKGSPVSLELGGLSDGFAALHAGDQFRLSVQGNMEFNWNVSGTGHPLYRVGNNILKGRKDTNRFEVRNAADTAYAAIGASEFITSSSRKLKTNVEAIDDIGLYVINGLKVVGYDLIDNVQNGIYDRKVGLIAEDSPAVATADQEAINTNTLIHYNVKATQELSSQVRTMQDEILWLKLENQYMKQKIKQLEAC
ncbi:phage tail spike protein [Alkalihalophilus lindianensis]|uniref:Phage tail spike protein n=1 Tax=Alkalihalophilus lindianensis TaxID=1630542 RepID=A0ABU3X7C4_9BACI|nr:phage tail spike protein [Alkalihalophilus lindianensis]MDV2683798.1 phage tail spike protein [Alkalihalophilus lindianensis]MDV2683864.1 phage tail spike protein [Alkalihalophilus lindianensis]